MKCFGGVITHFGFLSLLHFVLQEKEKNIFFSSSNARFRCK
jgi:hypothetical protein